MVTDNVIDCRQCFVGWVIGWTSGL